MNVEKVYNQYIEQSSYNGYLLSGYAEYNDMAHTDVYRGDEHQDEHQDRHEDGVIESDRDMYDD